MITLRWYSIARLLDSQERPCIHWPIPIGIRTSYEAPVPVTAKRIFKVWDRAVLGRGAIIAYYTFRGGMYLRTKASNTRDEWYSPPSIIDTTDDMAVERFKLVRAAKAYRDIQLGFYDGKHFQG